MSAAAASADHTRGSILLEEAEVLAHDAHPGAQRILRLHSPRVAAAAQPGSFVHLRCDERLPMRRPMSIMRADAEAGWLEMLYKVVGTGTGLLAERVPGDRISVLGPIGRGFNPDPKRPLALLLGGGVGIQTMLFLAERLLEQTEVRPLVLMGSEAPFPFATRPSTILVGGMPAGVIAGIKLLDDWGVPSRLASLQGFPGCHEGYVTDLARAWLDSIDSELRQREVAVYACGPTPMLRATASLAADYGVPCQVSLEEFMACAVGGCAGCAVQVRTAEGDAMKRVCVDGPVFAGADIVWEAIPH